MTPNEREDTGLSADAAASLAGQRFSQDEPGKDGGPRRHFVMLYDSVPGGTGYLHQLLAQDAGTLSDVLRMALDAVNQCAYNADPEKDGC